MSSAGIAIPRPGIDAAVKDMIRKGLIALAVAFTNIGTSIITNRIIQAGTAPKFIGWGTGTTAAAVTQTALVTETAPTTAGGRTSGSESRTTITNGSDNYQVAGTITATLAGPTAITEAATFDAASVGNMLSRAVFSPVNVVAGDAIACTFGLQMIANVV